MNARKMGVVIAGLLLAAVSGCAQQPLVRAPIDPANVRVFSRQPISFSYVGSVKTDENVNWGPHYDIEPVMDSLLAQAAAMGANGLLLEPDLSWGAGWAVGGGFYRGEFLNVPFQIGPPRVAVARAISVPGTARARPQWARPHTNNGF